MLSLPIRKLQHISYHRMTSSSSLAAHPRMRLLRFPIRQHTTIPQPIRRAFGYANTGTMIRSTASRSTGEDDQKPGVRRFLGLDDALFSSAPWLGGQKGRRRPFTVPLGRSKISGSNHWTHSRARATLSLIRGKFNVPLTSTPLRHGSPSRSPNRVHGV